MKEVKISIDGLELGMYVSRLDRPWVGTPFLLQGLKISSKSDIERLRKYCQFVYVDVALGVSPDSRYWILKDKPKAQVFGVSSPSISKAQEDKERAEYHALRTTTYASSTSFTVELSAATTTSQRLSKHYDRLVNDLQSGRDLDLQVVKQGVSDMVESVVRNPSAMMWIVQMRESDQYIYSRALGTSVWCATFGRHLGLEKVAINQLALGGLLLDVGKSKLPAKLLQKTGKLSELEQKAMRDHVTFGLKMLVKRTEGEEQLDQEVLRMIATHHERADGSGYPQGLEGTNIPIYGRIAGIVDSYDAITSKRPYGGQLSRTPHAAIADLYHLRGTKFQAELVEQFIQTVGLYPTGSLVELNTGQIGVVVEINNLYRLQPKLMLLLDGNKEPYLDFGYLDLATAEGDIRVERALEPGSYGINMNELFL